MMSLEWCKYEKWMGMSHPALAGVAECGVSFSVVGRCVRYGGVVLYWKVDYMNDRPVYDVYVIGRVSKSGYKNIVNFAKINIGRCVLSVYHDRMSINNIAKKLGFSRVGDFMRVVL